MALDTGAMDVESFDKPKAGEAVRTVSGAGLTVAMNTMGADVDERMARGARQRISPMCRVAPTSTFFSTVLREIAIKKPVRI